MGHWKLVYIPSEKEIEKSWSQRILKKLPFILKSKYIVWCRNGNVVDLATPCEEIKCRYKKNKNDIIAGCAKCKEFQITNNCYDWESARHTHEYGDVIKER